ncbi:hypothetical protein ME3_00457 [Bartonella melophagi K-2C]|uniref:Uncharacterized protein n=1 Tax=Bartonella melophagi K-2C TaxID=1094557 RepID=J0QZ53_9HYPH|nr:hypothetical protein ME3_00457 [Bartonella melophagi K-2C]
MILNITTIHETDDLRHNIREKDLVGRQQQFIAEGKVVLSALLHSKDFSALSLLIVAACLLGIMPILKATKPTCSIYCVPQKVIDDIAGFHVHRGMLGIGERKTLPSLQRFLKKSSRKNLGTSFMWYF